jgi:hypothetical protein
MCGVPSDWRRAAAMRAIQHVPSYRDDLLTDQFAEQPHQCPQGRAGDCTFSRL